MAGFSVTGRHVVVVGAARSGVAAAELVASRGGRVTLSEARPGIADAGRLRLAGIALELGGHRPETFAAADLIVTSPGVPLRQPAGGEEWKAKEAIEAARQAGVPVIGEIELASRWLRGRIVAISGTKGKSTTTTLIGRMLDAAGRAAIVGGNIGTPLSSQVDRSTPETLHVVEVSSFQLEATETFHPWIAVLLNFSADHLDRHASVEEYAAAKARIFANQDERDWIVINADDPQALAIARGARARRRPFAMDAPIEEGIVLSRNWIVERRPGDDDTPLVPTAAVRLMGRHLLSDVLAAAAAARIAGVGSAPMTRAVASFAGLEHAMEPAGEIGAVRFVNDSKATNVESARQSIDSFGGGLVVILGGRFKGGDLRALRLPLASKARAVVAIGEARPLIRAALEGVVPVREAESFADAVRVAYDAARPDGTVLLAPACASFDMFDDYAERGRRFKEEVARLAVESRPMWDGPSGPPDDDAA